MRFPKCDLCPVPADLLCHAQRTGAAHAYCRPIAAGDRHKLALVADLSAPPAADHLPDVTHEAGQALVAQADVTLAEPKPGGCGCG
jgi:hypothetical protein